MTTAINLTETAAVEAATAIIENKSKRVAKSKLTPEQEEGRDNTIAELQAKAEEGTRVTYARFAELARANGWIGESKISDGQRGAGLLRQVPAELQYNICQSSGRYHEKAKAKFFGSLPVIGEKTPEEVMEVIRYLPAEGPGGNMQTFESKRDREAAQADALSETVDQAL